TRVLGNQTTSRSYALATGGNRPAGFSQTIGTTTTSVAYGYNANGDLTSDGLNGFGYDAEGRMTSASVGTSDSSPTTRYAHNALGQRVFKTAPLFPIQGSAPTDLAAFRAKGWTPASTTAEKTGTAYTYDEDGNLIAETSSNPSSPGTTLYVYLPTEAGAMPVATVINGTHYAVSIDHLNTPRRLTSSAGQVMWQWAYSAFGETAPTTAAKRFTGPETVPTTGSTAATPATFNLRFPGMYYDSESGLSYNYFRSYSPTTGRYTQNDPIGLNGGLNRFNYVGANPLKYADPIGLCPMCLIPALPYVGEAAVVAAAWWASQNTLQEKTPNRGNPWDWHTNPGSGQERLYGPDGRPTVDIDWDHDHGSRGKKWHRPLY
ncbi:MAG: hypothetical protein EOP77_04330, partial [Variovorax sp.]